MRVCGKSSELQQLRRHQRATEKTQPFLLSTLRSLCVNISDKNTCDGFVHFVTLPLLDGPVINYSVGAGALSIIPAGRVGAGVTRVSLEKQRQSLH